MSLILLTALAGGNTGESLLSLSPSHLHHVEETTFVEYYSPRDYPAFAPRDTKDDYPPTTVWDALAKKVLTGGYSKPGYKLGRVDCDAHYQQCLDNGVYQFPTYILYFAEGGELKYHGDYVGFTRKFVEDLASLPQRQTR
jgi:hypothetical protein